MLYRRIGAAPFLRVIARALPQYPAFVVIAPVFMMACAAFALTMVSVEVVDRARARVVSVDRLYKAVFA